MRLTTARSHLSPDSFPTRQLFLLALCRTAEPIALTSIFPYAWVMVKGFDIGDKNDASFYAGILIAAFALAEALTGMWWGSLSDRIGRKPVLLIGCFGTMISLLVVGFSTNFYIALLGRIGGGLLNGNAGVIQTMVGELVKKPEHEPRAFSVMPFVWAIGTIIGPAIGGTLADPSTSFPRLFSSSGLFGRFPWLLPNVICALIMFGSIISSYFCLDETHPDLQGSSNDSDYHETAEQTPMIIAAGVEADPGVDLRQESYGTFNEVQIHKDVKWDQNADGSSRAPSISEKSGLQVFNGRVSTILVAMSVFTFHAMAYDHLLPIFFQDDRIKDTSASALSPFAIPGGLGLTTQTVGLVMAVNGLIAMIMQVIVFPMLASLLGVWNVFVICTLFHPVAYFIVPYLYMLPKNLLFPGIYFCLAVRQFFQILVFPVILILLKQASPSPSVLGKINGLAASAGAITRTVAPPVFGLLYGVGHDIGFTGLAYWSAGAVALIGSVQLYFVPRRKDETTTVRSVLPCVAAAQPHETMEDVVHIVVTEAAGCEV